MTAPRLFIAVMLAVMLAGCGASLKDLASSPCGFDLMCDPDDTSTWSSPPPLKMAEAE